MDWAQLVLMFALCFVATAAGLRPLVRLLRERAILDHPNERSSHTVPTARGGGLVVVPVILAGWLAVAAGWVGGSALHDLVAPVAAAAVLMAVSWVDDLRGVPVLVRLCVQLGCIGAVLLTLPEHMLLLQGAAPLWADRLLALVAWVWFVNLFNFMDGIDGISAVETIVISGGIAVLGLTATEATRLLAPAMVLLAAAAGFLPWNWHPARIFLGDVGSAPIGFLLGWLLLSLAFTGQWGAALILPGYYLVDATFTLARRALRGEKVWRSHRQHFYQRAVAAGLGHRMMSGLVGAVGAVLAALAILAGSGYSAAALPAAGVLVAIFLACLARLAGKIGARQGP